MRIFLSHASRQKPIVREIRGHLPPFLGTWLDEEHLLFGDDLASSIREAITVETDYVLLFVDERSVSSSWVRREVAWALEVEATARRQFLLPVLLEEVDASAIDRLQFRERRFLRLLDYTEQSVRSLAKGIGEALFALVVRDMQRLHNPDPKNAMDRMRESELMLKEHAALIHKVVFPHRESNPLAFSKLHEIVRGHQGSELSASDFREIMEQVAHRALIPGLSYDGEVAYLVEEHAQWKRELNRERKEKIGRRASAFVLNGARVLLDAGSTTEEVARVLCRRIETRAITRITIGTTSANIADMVSDCCVRMGFDDDYSAVVLLIPGGRIRPNTQAIVPLRGRRSDIVDLADEVGGFDLGFVGVNGVHTSGGFTTHANEERKNKAEILKVAKRNFVIGDSSKAGIVLEERFGGFEDDFKWIVDQDLENAVLQTLVERHSASIILVE